MIETNPENLINFLKTKSSEIIIPDNNINNITNSTKNLINNPIEKTSNNLEIITNLLGKINDLVNSPLIEKLLNQNQIENKNQDKSNDDLINYEEEIKVPDGYNKIDNYVEEKKNIIVNEINYEKISSNLYDLLEKTLKELINKNENIKINDVLISLKKKEVQEDIKKQIEYILKDIKIEK